MKIDLHVHIKKTSRCAKSDHIEMAKQAKEIGLDGIVLLDHHYYLEDKELHEAEAISGIKIFRGIEISVKVRDTAICGTSEGANDVVFISPVHPVFAYGKYHEPMPSNELPNLISFSNKNGGLTILAHPFRRGHPLAINPAGLDCVEIASRSTRKEDRTRILELAEKYSLKCVATSDSHKTRHLGRYCIDLDYNVNTEEELSAAVKQGHFTLLEERLAPVLCCKRN